MSSNDDIGGKNSRNDTTTAQLVEQGIEFHKILGRTVAIAFVKEQQVPADVICRIFGSSSVRWQSAPSTTPPRKGGGWRSSGWPEACCVV